MYMEEDSVVECGSRYIVFGSNLDPYPGPNFDPDPNLSTQLL